MSNLNEQPAIDAVAKAINTSASQLALNEKLMKSGILLTDIVPLIAMFAVEKHSIPEAADTMAINKLAGLYPSKTYKELCEIAENFLNLAHQLKIMQNT